MKIGIAGIGGIGSNVARILAQAGQCHIKVVDFDRVEAANLNRQFYTLAQVGRLKTRSLKENLNAIRPDMDIEILNRRILPGDAAFLFSDCGVVIEGLDRKNLKKMLIEDLSETPIPVVSASGITGPDMTGIRVKKIGHCQIVGDFVSDEDSHGLYPPKIAVVAGLMADIALKTAGKEP